MPNRIIRYKLGWSFKDKVGLVALRWGEGNSDKAGFAVTAKELAAVALLLEKPPVFFDPQTGQLVAEIRTGLTTAEAHGAALKKVSAEGDGGLGELLDEI